MIWNMLPCFFVGIRGKNKENQEGRREERKDDNNHEETTWCQQDMDLHRSSVRRYTCFLPAAFSLDVYCYFCAPFESSNDWIWSFCPAWLIWRCISWLEIGLWSKILACSRISSSAYHIKIGGFHCHLSSPQHIGHCKGHLGLVLCNDEWCAGYSS